MFDLPKIFSYMYFLDEFRRIKRVIYATGEERLENDMEHSYQLTMLAWYFIDAYRLNLDTNLVIKYCLVHDLVEVYAGDTYIYSQDAQHLNSKIQREEDALLAVRQKFQEFPEMVGYIEQYEHKNDPEANFIYALDKIIPVLNIYMDNGRAWKDLNLSQVHITIESLRAHKDEKIQKSPELYTFWLQFIEILETNRKDLFLPE